MVDQVQTGPPATPAAVPLPPPKWPWLTPAVALAIGGLAIAATIGLLVWVAAAEPDCSTGGIPALTLAGTPERAEQILACEDLTVDAARSETNRDLPLIGTYVLTIAAWCAYGGLRSRRTPTRLALYGMIPVVAFAGVLDLIENGVLLLGVFDDEEKPATLSPGVVTTMFAVSLARWILVAVTAFVALCVVAGTVAKAARTLWGSSTRPGYLGPLPQLPDPSPYDPDADDLDDDAARDRRFDGPGRSSPTADTVGIGLSGGGIRAASVALGALQSLIAAGVYGQARYLASVSGGGYLAGASQVVARFGDDHPVSADPPFAPADTQRASSVDAPETEFVSKRARFLWPPVDRTKPATKARRKANLASTRTFFSSAMWGILGIAFNVSLILIVLYVVVTPIGWLARLLYSEPGGDYGGRITFPGGWLAIGLVLIGLGPHMAAFLWGFFGTFAVADPDSERTGRGRAPRIVLVAVILIGGAIGVGALLRWGLPASAWWPGWTWSLLGLISAFVVIALVLALIVERSPKGTPAIVMLAGLVLIAGNWLDVAIENGPEADTTWRAAVTFAAVLTGVIVFVSVAAVFRLLPIPRGRVSFAALAGLAILAGLAAGTIAGGLVWATTDEYRIGPAWVVYLSCTVAVLAGYTFLDQKRWSPHPIYKRRLAGTFSPVRYRGDTGIDVDQLPYSTRTTLSRWLTRVEGHPELLICAAAYDTRKAVGKVRAWPFVFSYDYVGGSDVGWTRTVDFEAALGRSNAADGTLLAAMAVSGAAVSPGLGQINLGSLNIVLALLNARLGVWLPNPRYINELRDPERWSSREGPALRWLRTRRATYLLKEVLGIHDRDDRFVYVTDGGQIDNLGLLELLSRRCTHIICIDASGDDAHTTNTFDGIRRIAADRLGVRFTPLAGASRPLADEPEDYSCRPAKLRNGWLTPELCDRPARSTLTNPWPYAGGLVERLAVNDIVELGIEYPDTTTGTLIYAKALLTAAAPCEILEFADRSPTFPRDSTADQFLDPDEVEHYVSLGRHIGRRAGDLARPHLQPPDAGDGGDGSGPNGPPPAPHDSTAIRIAVRSPVRTIFRFVVRHSRHMMAISPNHSTRGDGR